MKRMEVLGMAMATLAIMCGWACLSPVLRYKIAAQIGLIAVPLAVICIWMWMVMWTLKQRGS